MRYQSDKLCIKVDLQQYGESFVVDVGNTKPEISRSIDEKKFSPQ